MSGDLPTTKRKFSFLPDNFQIRSRLKCRHFGRILEEGDFASDFHIYGLQRLPNSIRFYVDGIPIGQVDPPPGGFWDIGHFDQNPGGPNIWANGTSMTPFDYPVSCHITSRTSKPIKC